LRVTWCSRTSHRHLVVDVAVSHEFGSDQLADVRRNGARRDAQPDRILESRARTKVDSYTGAGYAAINYAFLPCVISTSGRVGVQRLSGRPHWRTNWKEGLK